jgi:hypothetical protein
MGEGTKLADAFRAAGIPDARIELQQGRGRFPSIRSLVEVDVRDWLPIAGIMLEDSLIEAILRDAEAALRPHVVQDANGVAFASPAVVATATKPN